MSSYTTCDHCQLGLSHFEEGNRLELLGMCIKCFNQKAEDVDQRNEVYSMTCRICQKDASEKSVTLYGVFMCIKCFNESKKELMK